MIYLDHAATTPMFPEVLEAMLPWYDRQHVGNPGSIHTQGVAAKKAVEEARENVAQMIGANPGEVYFTSSATEANNMWFYYMGRNIVFTDALEHSSVLEPVKQWGYYTRLKTNPDGVVDLEDLRACMERQYLSRGSYCGVSVAWVNNELGTINPIKEIGGICDCYGRSFHTDATQAAGHVPIDVRECHIGALSMSAHKFGGPMGVGVLYTHDGHCSRFIKGGWQENGMRAGTENVPGIVGTGVAAKIVKQRLSEWQSNWKRLRQLFIHAIIEYLPGKCRINGGENVSPNIISLTIPGVESESLLFQLDIKGICVSAGSACSAINKEPSHVLLGVGMSREEAASTIRISMGVDTTEREMLTTAKAIAESVQKIREC